MITFYFNKERSSFNVEPRSSLSKTSVMLLARHNLAHFGFAIFDDITTDIEGHAVDRAGEFEGGLVVESHGRTGISTDDETTTRSHAERDGMREIGLPDQLSSK